MNLQSTGNVDTRHYSDGRTRLRFRLTAEQSAVVDQALISAYSISSTLSEGKALCDICLDFISSESGSHSLRSSPGKQTRRLFRLYQDQYEVVRAALNRAREFTRDDAAALAAICQRFVKGCH